MKYTDIQLHCSCMSVFLVNLSSLAFLLFTAGNLIIHLCFLLSTFILFWIDNTVNYEYMISQMYIAIELFHTFQSKS